MKVNLRTHLFSLGGNGFRLDFDKKGKDIALLIYDLRLERILKYFILPNFSFSTTCGDKEIIVESMDFTSAYSKPWVHCRVRRVEDKDKNIKAELRTLNFEVINDRLYVYITLDKLKYIEY